MKQSDLKNQHQKQGNSRCQNPDDIEILPFIRTALLIERYKSDPAEQAEDPYEKLIQTAALLYFQGRMEVSVLARRAFRSVFFSSLRLRCF